MSDEVEKIGLIAKVSRRDLKPALDRLNIPVFANRPSNVEGLMYSQVRIIADPAFGLRLRVDRPFNSDINRIEVRVDAEVEAPGNLGVDAREFAKLIRPAGPDEVELREIPKLRWKTLRQLEVRRGGSLWKLNAQYGEDAAPRYVGLDAELRAILSVDVLAFRSALEKANKHAGIDDLRYYLNGVLVQEVDGNKLRLVGTDGCRLASIDVTDVKFKGGPRLEDFIIPRVEVLTLLRALKSVKPKDDVRLSIMFFKTDGIPSLRFELDDEKHNWKLMFYPIDGKYPNFEQLFRKALGEVDHKISFPSNETEQVLRNAVSASPKPKNKVATPVVLTVSQPSDDDMVNMLVKLWAKEEEEADGFSSGVKVSHIATGRNSVRGDVKFGLNPVFLADILQSLSAPEAHFHYSSKGLVKKKGSGGYEGAFFLNGGQSLGQGPERFLVMPVRIL